MSGILGFLTIAPIEDSDLPFLWDMLYEAVYVPPGIPKPARSILADATLRRYVDGYGRPGDYGLTAAVEGRKVGAVWCRRFSPCDPGYGFYASSVPELTLAVSPSHRGRGMGTRLLGQFLTELSRRGEDAVSLSVQPANPAVRLYTRQGFVRVGGVDDAWTMVKKLR